MARGQTLFQNSKQCPFNPIKAYRWCCHQKGTLNSTERGDKGFGALMAQFLGTYPEISSDRSAVGLSSSWPNCPDLMRASQPEVLLFLIS
ncbi:hypothetical protein PoB_005259300 [Plakobranchus ocellatus]|uniref:Uncharacterized protein n=1 Tax=Plakobranchus ocellatus TaxID=259542 RepID=A0AAV4C3U7_9GAST|nr:hypothetical protein PoB_005259300 [Plakobranchus ocellatus]